MMRIFKSLWLFFLSACLLGACASPDVPQGIPDFSMVMPATNQVFHSKDIPAGKPSIIIWFDPNCRDCQEEAEYILAEMEKFRNFNIYMVTRHPHDELMVFYDHLRLDTCKNMKVGIDTAAVIPREFQIRSTPITLIYSEDKILRAVFRGKPKPAQLAEVINKKV